MKEQLDGYSTSSVQSGGGVIYTYWQLFWKRVARIIRTLTPYVRVARILVTFIAPIVLGLLYLLHQSYRTSRVQEVMRSFRSARRFFSMGGFGTGSTDEQGILELAQHNDIFWVRLTQVIATLIGY